MNLENSLRTKNLWGLALLTRTNNFLRKLSRNVVNILLLLFTVNILVACNLETPTVCYSTTSIGRGALSFTASQTFGRDRDLIHVKELGPNGELRLIYKIYSYRIFKTRQLIADVAMQLLKNDWVVKRVVKAREARNIRRLILQGIRKFENNHVKPFQIQNYRIENQGWFWM